MNFIQKKSSVLSGLIIAIACSILLALACFYFALSIPIYFFIFHFVIIFLTSYIIFYYGMVQKFYRRFENIFINIYQHKNKGIIPSRLLVNDEELYNEIISELKNWESEQQLEIAELKKAEVYRREFLGNVSHELKTPLFSAQGYVHTLIDGGIDDADINLLYLQKASKSLDRLIVMVDDLESITRLEKGDIPLEMRTFDIVDLIKDVFDSLELIANEKNIILNLKENNNQQFYVLADKDRIRQVLVNLIENSIKYGKENGETRVHCFSKNGLVYIEVSDNGIGIDAHYLPRLFERFFRVDKSRSRDIGGTGLGLAIVKHILEAHQQGIAVDSTPGKGTTFSFSLKESRK